MHAAFLGLGALGRAIAGRLIDTGVELTVWNRTPGKAEGLTARTADSPVVAASVPDVIFLCLADSTAVHSLLHEQGLLKACEGKLIIDTTTNHYQNVLDFHRDVQAAGGRYLECPVAGSVVPASKGELTLLTGGRDDDLETARPYLERIGRKIHHFPKPGDASRMKLVNNLALGSIMAALAESLAVGEAAGLDRAVVLDVLADGGGESLVLRAKKQKLLDRDWSPHFKTATIHKDLTYLLELAAESDLTLGVGEAVRARYAAAIEKGLGEMDFAGVGEAG
jgi:3-hydroxyisobutyrate dehydrogenase